LEAESNPFGLVTMAHRRAKETRARNMTAAKQRLYWRRELTKLLFAKGWPKEQQHDLFRFIDLVLTLPAALKAKFKEEVAEMEAETMDSFMSSFEEDAWIQGEEEGRKEGRKEGRLHQMRMLQRQLTRRYGELPPWAVERLERATVEQLDRWGDRLFDAETVEELFADE
jgi:predicted transposase YdaD